MPGWPPNTATPLRPSRASSWSSIPPERSGRRSSTSSTAMRTRTCRRPRRPIDRPGRALPRPPQRSVPEIAAEPQEEQGRDELRDRIDIEERRLDQLLLVPGEEAQGRAEDAAQRAAGHQPGGDDHPPLADAPP